jgi:oligopeptide/dipeptide ABC transporter ATP-binding protein
MGSILEVDGLTLSYRTARHSLRALDGATLAVGAGEAVGLVGESGSGKSTLARAVLGLLPRPVARIESGTIRIDGRDVTSLAEDGWARTRGSPIAIVFQDPLSFLNPVMRIGTQIGESVSRHSPHLPRTRRVAELLELVRLPAACARHYPHELSGGMRQRVLLAIAIGCGPQLLIADEPTTALDATTQAEILGLLRELRQRLTMAMLLISHDLGVVASACERVYVMYAGRIIEWGAMSAVFTTPAHPYTAGLIDAARCRRDAAGRFATIAGDPLQASLPAAGCAFAPRCGRADARCRREVPGVSALAGGHRVRCWHPCVDAREERPAPPGCSP